MQEQIEKEASYQIPAKMPTRWELFPGIGWSEIFVIALFFAVGMALFFLLGIPQVPVKPDEITMFGQTMTTAVEPNATQSMVPVQLRIVLVAVFAGIGYFLVQQGSNGTSLLAGFVYSHLFNKSKRSFQYRTKGLK